MIAEAPTYPGAVPVFSSDEAETVQVGVDGDGVDEIEEGIRRIGAVVAEQLELFDSITSEHEIPRPSADPAAPEREAEEAGGTSVILPFRRGRR